MPHDESRARVALDIEPSADPRPAAPLRDGPLTIVVVGNFRGVGTAGTDAAGGAGEEDASAPSIGPVVAVDRDELDRAVARLAPRLRFDVGGGEAVELAFHAIDDFHPDHILATAPVFADVTGSGAARDDRESDRGAGRKPADADPPDPERTGAEAPDIDAMLSGSVLDRILDEGDRPESPDARAEPPTGPTARGPRRPPDALQDYIRRVTEPHVVRGGEPADAAARAAVEEALADALRRVLHDPAFQRLEALWRGVELLVRRLETGVSLRVRLVPATMEALRADMRDRDPGTPGGGGSALASALRDATSDGPGPVVVLDHSFAADADDLALLDGIARTVHAAGGALLAAAEPDLVGLEDAAGPPLPHEVRPWDDERWQAFRRTPHARAVCLGLPRILLRAPYGPDTDPVEAIAFEEVGAPPDAAHLLLGSPAFVCALLLGEAFTASGWAMRPGERSEVAGLPVHTWRAPDGPGIAPCTEWPSPGQAAPALLEAGLTVLAPVGHGDTAQVVRLRSVASPPTALAGPWAHGVG